MATMECILDNYFLKAGFTMISINFCNLQPVNISGPATDCRLDPV